MADFNGTCGGQEAACERFPNCESSPICPEAKKRDVRDLMKIGGALTFKLRGMPVTGTLKTRRAAGLPYGVVVSARGVDTGIDARSIVSVEAEDGSTITKIPFNLKV